MADQKISQLSSGAPAQAGDEYVVARSGANYKLTLTNIAANMPATTVASGDLIVSSGNVQVGTTTAAAGGLLTLNRAPAAAFGTPMLQVGGASFTSGGYYSIGLGFTDATYTEPPGEIAFATTSDSGGTLGSIVFGTRSVTTNTAVTERMRIDSSGNVGIGGTADAYDRLGIKGTLPIQSGISNGTAIRATFGSGTTSEGDGFVTVLSTENASFTLPNLYHFHAVQGTKGASSTITNQMGFVANSNLTGATNNYGFYSNIASGSNRWNFYAAGTADNYFAGRVSVGTTSVNLCAGNVAGIALGTTADGTAAVGAAQFSASGNPGINVNRKTDDGALIGFYQDGALEGTISVSGNTVSYNPFMGSHYTEIVGAMPTLKGTVLESLDELVDGKYSNQDRLPKAKVSDTVGSGAVYGVYFAPDSDPDTNDGILAAALGASWVRIAAGVTVQRGDLLESNGDGCAKVQSDDIIRSKTIGKVTSTTVADTYADGSYIVPCVLYCG